jgi:very-short-patch-repair endonuclease
MAKYSETERRELKNHKRRMRSYPTKGEDQFKREVCDPLGIKFKTQKIVIDTPARGDSKGYILDFYLPEYKLCVEIDGKGHAAAFQRQYDAIRDSCLAKRGIRTIRFTNEEVKDVEACKSRMTFIMRGRKHEIVRRSWVPKQKRLSNPDVDRFSDLAAQEAFIKANGVKRLPPLKENRKF